MTPTPSQYPVPTQIPVAQPCLIDQAGAFINGKMGAAGQGDAD